MVGIVQEQHPERARLFMQWREMEWPVLVDPLNLLGVAVVPITLLIDEAGVVRYRGELEGLERFLAEPAAPAGPAAVAKPSLDQPAVPSPEALRRHADALFLWGGPEGLDRAIDAYRRALDAAPDHAPTRFRLGVAYRARHDSPRRQPGDFRRAVEHWGAALELEPDQYDWRRRIQQYGPRLAKPYPFYDWVDAARREISARDETPVALAVEPLGAELAGPAKRFDAAPESPAEPDPEGRIRRDARGFIDVEQTVVPAALEPGAAGRVHLIFRPNPEIGTHWNNEVDDLVLWVDPPPGWKVERRLSSVPNPPEPVSAEERRIELEVESPADFRGTARLDAYALYYVCEDVRGACLYRRQDVALRIEGAR